MPDDSYKHPEPVPAASQLAVLPFLAAVDGFLRDGGDVSELRITVHRTMSREGSGYLQQVCAYVRGERLDSRGKVGRRFPVTEGIMGAAFEQGTIWRTKRYPTLADLQLDLATDMASVNDKRPLDDVAISYLAVPLLGPQDQPVLIFYADCKGLNYFADDTRVRSVVSMCKGFCRVFDNLQSEPFSNLKNFPLQKGKSVAGTPTVYGRIQEPFKELPAPRFNAISSFNYEASVG